MGPLSTDVIRRSDFSTKSCVEINTGDIWQVEFTHPVTVGAFTYVPGPDALAGEKVTVHLGNDSDYTLNPSYGDILFGTGQMTMEATGKYFTLLAGADVVGSVDICNVILLECIDAVPTTYGFTASFATTAYSYTVGGADLYIPIPAYSHSLVTCPIEIYYFSDNLDSSFITLDLANNRLVVSTFDATKVNLYNFSLKAILSDGTTTAVEEAFQVDIILPSVSNCSITTLPAGTTQPMLRTSLLGPIVSGY